MLLAVLLLLTAACESQPETAEPTPSPELAPEPSPPQAEGGRVAVVLPPVGSVPSAELADVRRQLDAFDLSAYPDLSELRLVMPDAPEFQTDAVTVLAEAGYDLVCVLGPGAARAVSDLARDFPRTLFCALPARFLSDQPGNVLGLAPRVSEVAFLGGAAGAAVSAEDEPPGLIYQPLAYGASRLPEAFEGGMEYQVRAERPPPPMATANNDEAAREHATNMYEGGSRVVMVRADGASAAVVEVADEFGGLVIGPAAVIGLLDAPAEDEGEDPSVDDPDQTDGPRPASPVLYGWRLRADRALAIVLDRLDPWDGGTVSVGLAEDVWELVPGTSPVWDAVEPRLRELEDLVAAGTVAVPGAEGA